MGRRSVLTLVFVFTLLSYALIFLFASVWSNSVTIAPAVIAAAIICGIWNRRQTGTDIPIGRQARLAFFMALGVTLSEVFGTLLISVVVMSTYSEMTYSEVVIMMLSDELFLIRLRLGVVLIQLIALWLVTTLGLLIGQYIFQRTIS